MQTKMKMNEQANKRRNAVILKSVSLAALIVFAVAVWLVKFHFVARSPYRVTHVFFHSLVVDPARGFSMTDESDSIFPFTRVMSSQSFPS